MLDLLHLIKEAIKTKRRIVVTLLLVLGIVVSGFAGTCSRKSGLFAQQTQAQSINNPVNVSNYSWPNVSFSNYEWLPLSEDNKAIFIKIV